MAEQSSHDVVNQTRSGGEISSSDIPASNPVNLTAGGDVEGAGSIAKDQTLPMNANLAENTPGASGTTEGSHPDKKPEVNGVRSTLNTGEYGASSSNLAEASGGSDTDTSRTDRRTAADSNQHSRTSSVKRPASFKPVSFAKFSVSKSPSMQPTKPSSEKAPFSSTTSPSPSAPSSRPRLVAKSGSGLRDSTPKSRAIGKESPSAPDPSQVWNKNRPAQPPSTKHLTDEELKLQYGIHMTSRIQEDGEGKEAKWADIDDDEDDWAPETIEWNDGTKITLTQTEPAPALPQAETDVKAKKPSPPLEENRITRESSKLVMSKPSSIGPNATILRPGASAEKQQSKTIAPTSKGPGEKPTLVSKSPAAPTKSPWAQLPPVDKVPPVAINPPVQAPPPSRFPPRDQHPSEQPQVPPYPTKEIAADDFNRSWRDSQSGATRELFNSQSGRYEPVSEHRKGSVRNEQHFRPPSLLQRPVHNEQPGPAEPSAAFQTHRTGPSQDAGAWGRRRASSNVSGGSGGFGRRMSIGRPDMAKGHEFRRGSQVNGPIDRPPSPRTADHQRRPYGPVVSPTEQPVDPARQNRTGPGYHYAPPGYQPGFAQQPGPHGPNEMPPQQQQQPPAAPAEDPIALQQRIMREKRDLARQRRKEEEEREEAAKQERIRLKLESMGLPPVGDKQPAKKESPTPAPAEPSKPAATVQSPPKPPVPEPTGEPKQYGMMKVHHPDTVKKFTAAGDRPPERPIAASHNRQPPSPSLEARPEPRTSTAPTTNGVRPSAESSPTQSRPQLATDEKPAQWKVPASAPISYTSWVGQKPSAHPPTASSLWASPNNDKALGNGTFDRGFQGFPPRDLTSRGPLGLGDQLPIGAPSANDRIGSAELLPQPFPSAPASMADNGLPSSPLPSPEKSATRPAGNEPPKPISRPGPIGPPSSHQRWHQEHAARRAPEVNAWHDFHAVAAKKDAEDNEKFRREMAAAHEEQLRTGINPSLQVNFEQTWRKVEAGDQAGQRQVVGVARPTDIVPSLSPLHGFGPTVGGMPFSEDPTRLLTGTTGRESRFFPQSEQSRRYANQDVTSYRSSSPPPPEDVTSHPVFMGDADKPLVHLPAPKPRVKLPPQHASPPPAPATFASMVASNPPLRAAPQPIASTTSWQDRFNGLFGKKPASPKKPEKTHALAVTSATKESLDFQSHVSSASVSLPQHNDAQLLRDADKVASKEVEDEEAIFEDREAGSLPVVRVPNMAPSAAWNDLPASQVRLRSKYLKPVQSLSVEPYFFGYYDKDNAGNFAITVHLPFEQVGKRLALPRKAGSGPSGPRSSRPPFAPKGRRNNPKARDGGGHGPQGSKRHPQGQSSNRTPASPRPQNNSTWANRVSGSGGAGQ